MSEFAKYINVPSRKGVFIPDITVEMLRNASLEGVGELMASGEMEDISLPSAQPERTGRWIKNSPVTMKCNQCGFVIKDWDWHRFKYCPNCGADMRGGKSETD